MAGWPLDPHQAGGWLAGGSTPSRWLAGRRIHTKPVAGWPADPHQADAQRGLYMCPTYTTQQHFRRGYVAISDGTPPNQENNTVCKM